MSDIRMSSFQAIPPVIKNLLIVNALVYFAQTVFENSESFNMMNLFALHDVHSVFFSAASTGHTPVYARKFRTSFDEYVHTMDVWFYA